MVLGRSSVERRPSRMETIDGALFVFAGLATVWLAYLLIKEGVRPGWPVLLLIAFWILLTYLLLPRLHRILTRLYVPGYFIGRTRTSDGLLGDPVNLALLGHEAQIHQSMERACWTRADDLSLGSGMAIVSSTLRRRSYPEAPVSPLLLFDRQQDFAYQQEVAGSPSKRHHVRFWRCPEGWMLPGGYAVDWLAAGTYDRTVGLSLFTLQVTHKIEQNTDIERDHIVRTLSTDPAVSVSVIKDFSTGYHSRNGGGDRIQTDGHLPVVDVRALDAPMTPDLTGTDSRNKRPAQTVFGAGVSLVRGLVSVLIVIAVLIGTPETLDFLGISLSDRDPITLTAVAIFFGLIAAADIGLGLAVLAGRNWARLLLMLVSASATSSAFLADISGAEVVDLAQLPTVASSILVLLALSSHRAREYATRRHHQRKRLSRTPVSVLPADNAEIAD